MVQDSPRSSVLDYWTVLGISCVKVCSWMVGLGSTDLGQSDLAPIHLCRVIVCGVASCPAAAPKETLTPLPSAPLDPPLS
jgi:hypothetical protein